MLLLGFEIHDVIRVVVGIALGLLTVYRRELSCNRSYHPDDDDDTLGESAHHRLSHEEGTLQERDGPSNSDHDGNNNSPSGVIRRRASSSALSSMIASQHDDDEQQHHVMDANFSTAVKKNEDSTEELLESAGMFLSGGPFLYMAIAVYDHLILTSFISTFTSVKLLLHRFRHEWPTPPCDEYTLEQQQLLESNDDSTESREQKEQHLYSVAWNAAAEYFTNKLDSASSPNKKSIQLQHNNDNPFSRRSKSTGNLQQNLSDKHTRALFLDMLSMANSGSMDITLLPSDAQIVIFSFLPPKDVLAFTCTNRAGRNLLEDGVDDVHGEATTADEDNSGSIHIKNGDTALLIWKALFERDYSWILTDWAIGKEALMRSMEHDELHNSHQQQQQHQSPKSGKVFRHLASTILDSEHAKELPIDSMIATSASTHPTSSMKEFYFKFTETWLNYTIAGCNSTEKCLIGLHGHVFDISNFAEHHPGSTETLLLQAGRDATVFFESMGHSLGARKIAMGMCVVVNGQCCRFHFTAEEDTRISKHGLRAGPIGPLYHTWGLIKPSCKSLHVKRDIPGFLLPRKRSMARHRGGLHRIRQRMKQEEELQLANAARWGNESIGPNGMFGGVQVYYDPFRGWRWWYTDRDFNPVFTTPVVVNDMSIAEALTTQIRHLQRHIDNR